jgi:hypothetical protein
MHIIRLFRRFGVKKSLDKPLDSPARLPLDLLHKN